MVSIVKGDFAIDQEYFIERSEKIISELELEGDVTIKFGGVRESKALNHQFRKKNYSTDVLSFPIHEKFPDSYYIGDILICYPIAKKQAEASHRSLKMELFTLICHGILHLAGYDHETDRGEMLKIQDHLISKYFQE